MGGMPRGAWDEPRTTGTAPADGAHGRVREVWAKATAQRGACWLGREAGGQGIWSSFEWTHAVGPPGLGIRVFEGTHAVGPPGVPLRRSCPTHTTAVR